MIKLDKKEQLIRKTVLGQWKTNKMSMTIHQLRVNNEHSKTMCILIFETENPNNILLKTNIIVWNSYKISYQNVIYSLIWEQTHIRPKATKAEQLIVENFANEKENK